MQTNSFTDAGLKALFFASTDALQSAAEQGDTTGAIQHLDNMKIIVQLMDTPRWTLESVGDAPPSISKPIRIDGSAA